MASSSLAVYTTIYPAARPFLAEWVRSVQTQTDRDFDLLIGLDGLTVDEASAVLGRVDATWIAPAPGAASDSPRAQGLAAAAASHDVVVLVDCDDVLLPTRVAAARAAIRSADVAGCALDLVDRIGSPLGQRLAPPEGTDLSALVTTRNVFGLSNTVWRSEVLRGCLPVPASCALVDWLLVSRACLVGARLAFDHTPRMLYRRHGRNIAFMGIPTEASDVLDASRRVLAHYADLLDGSWRVPAARRAPFDSARARVEAFDAALRGCPRILHRYLDAMKRQPPPTMWWSWVAEPELDDLWQMSSSKDVASRTASRLM